MKHTKHFYQFISPVMLGFFFMLLSKSGFSQTELSADIDKQTLVYAIEGADTLRLDVMRSSKYGSAEQPCLIFLFGGGFTTGNRDRDVYNAYFNRMADEGITVVSIDYRTTLDFSLNVFSGLVTLPGAINTAVTDLYSATTYVIENSAELHIDTAMILLSGTSAGAITVLHGDWYLSNRTGGSDVLPSDFSYKGVIAFSGGIFYGALYGSPSITYGRPPAPTLFYHGTSDTTVPYSRLSIYFIAFDGSSALAGRFRTAGYPYQMVTINGGEHNVASSAMTSELETTIEFIQSFVIEGNTYQIEEVI